MRFVSLFAGIGGFDLGLERAGWECVGQVEQNEFCLRVLEQHWPRVKRIKDVRSVKGDEFGPVDALCGGFPCQDLSVAGKRAGIDGDRSGLWSEYTRLIGVMGPEVVVVENVTNLLSGPSHKRGGWFGRVLSDLAALRYDAEWHCVPASYVGLRHLRDRVWIVAYPKRDGVQRGPNISAAWQSQSREEQLAGLLQPGTWPTVSGARDRGTGHGIPNGTHRNMSIGNAVSPQLAELIGRVILMAENHMSDNGKEAAADG